MDSVDRIIILDYPPIGNAFRMTKRYLKAKILGEGRIGMKLPEKFNPSLILRTFIWRKRQFPRLLENIPVAKRNKSVTILRSPKFALETIVRSIGG